MKIFYFEYAVLAVFGIIAAWRILRNVPDEQARKRKQRLGRNAGTSDEQAKSEQRKGKTRLT